MSQKTNTTVGEKIWEILSPDSSTPKFGSMLRCIKEKRGLKGHDVGDIARVCGLGAGGDKGKLFIEQAPLNSGLFKWLYKEQINDWELIGRSSQEKATHRKLLELLTTSGAKELTNTKQS